MILRSLAILGVAVVSCLACRLSPEASLGDECGVVMELPSAAGMFFGESGEIAKVETETLPSDTEIARMVYHTAGASAAQCDVATVSIVLAGSQRRSIHRPEVCLTGQGWSLLEAKTVPVEIGQGRVLQVRDLLIEKPVTLRDGRQRKLRAHYVYWFVGTDVTTASHFDRVWLSTWDSVLRNVNHRWAYPSVLALVTEDFEPSEIGERKRNAAQTLDMIQSLIRELVPQFQRSFMHPPTASAAAPEA